MHQLWKPLFPVNGNEHHHHSKWLAQLRQKCPFLTAQMDDFSETHTDTNIELVYENGLTHRTHMYL